MLDQLKKPPSDVIRLLAEQEEREVTQAVEADFDAQFKQLESQHKNFVEHAHAQIAKMEAQVEQAQCK